MKRISLSLFGLVFIGAILFSPALSFADKEKEREVEPGDVSVVVELELPDGYAVSDDAPSSVKAASSNGKALSFDGKPATSVPNPSFPLKIKARAAEGKTELCLEFNVYYCGHKDSSVCKAYRKSVTVPVTVARGPGVKSIIIRQKAN